MERRMSRDVVGVRILRREDSIAERIVVSTPVRKLLAFCEPMSWANVLSKLAVFTPMSSLSTPSHNRTAASLATFLFRRCSSIALIGLTKSSLVKTLPPTTFRKSPLIAPRLEPTRPLFDEEDCAFFSFAPSSIECTSLSRSLSTNCPFVVLVPNDCESIESTPEMYSLFAAPFSWGDWAE